MRVVATAGHVDHGKSTLVRALTGTDPDRLAEEQRRGLTIELGFAGMRLPSGETLAFVDVPGHRRFIGTMLGGLGPAPAVVFVVAADQGWQAQSQEHLDAVDALGIGHGLLVLTRCGLASDEQVRATLDQARTRVAESPLGDVPCVLTDAVDGTGLEDLRAELDRLVGAMPPTDPSAPVRFWTDRVFSVRGSGTVVTGTLAAGTVLVGDELELGGRRVVVRSSQVLGRAVDAAGPVSRVALGLRGVDVDDVPRGAVLLTPGEFDTSTVLDVRRTTGRTWGDASEKVTVHVGTASVEAHVRPLDDDHARLTLGGALPLRLGDRFIVRDPSAARIHCGAVVLDLDPSPFRRRGAAAARAAALADRSVGDADPIVDDHGVLDADRLHRIGGVAPSAVRLGGGASGSVLVSDRALADVGRQLDALLDADADDPLSRGVTVTVAAGRCAVPEAVVLEAARRADVPVREGLMRRADAGLGPAQEAVDEILRRLADHPFRAPEADDLTDLGLGARELAAAADRGVILRLPGDVVLAPTAPALAMRELARLGGPFTVSRAREAWGTTRRVAVPLLEHLDARGWTRRLDGSLREVVR